MSVQDGVPIWGSWARAPAGVWGGSPSGVRGGAPRRKNWPIFSKKRAVSLGNSTLVQRLQPPEIVLNSFHCCCSSALLCRFNRSYPHAKSCFLLPLRPSRHSRANVLMPNALSVLRCTICLLTGTMTIAGMPARAQRAFRKFFGFSRVRKAALCLTDFEVIQRI